jgi:hypothetical protein
MIRLASPQDLDPAQSDALASGNDTIPTPEWLHCGCQGARLQIAGAVMTEQLRIASACLFEMEPERCWVVCVYSHGTSLSGGGAGFSNHYGSTRESL